MNLKTCGFTGFTGASGSPLILLLLLALPAYEVDWCTFDENTDGADPGGGGFAYQAGIASIGEGGSVAVSFGTPFTGSVGAQGTYQPATGPPVLPLTLTASTTGLNIIGDVGSSVMWFAYNLNQ